MMRSMFQRSKAMMSQTQKIANSSSQGANNLFNREFNQSLKLSTSARGSASRQGSDIQNNNFIGDKHSDRLVVVGSGVAGSAAALVAAETYKIPVTLIFAGRMPDDCNSNWAQGGIIYRNYNPESGDSADLLASDIHRAGAGLCVDEAVRKVATEGPKRVRQLLLTGNPYASVPFDKRPDGEMSLCLEASHAAPRILHCADHTGRIITQHITMAAAKHPLIDMMPHSLVTDLIVEDNHCVGVFTLNRASGKLGHEYSSRGVVLASGGLGGIYQHSTNPAGFNALGSSVALASRAGVQLKDLEYVQFHPTSLYIPNDTRFLLTEALRGEGAILRDAAGRAFAKDFHPDGELAPRDIVARGVYEESQKSTTTHNVYLDITHRDKDWLHQRFPSIQAHLTTRGLDLARDPLPIIPAAHYTCGGIETDKFGRTSLPGLYAAGEAARTGLHGGNRLASTSLLEALVYGASVADFVGREEGKELKNNAQNVIQTMQPRPMSASLSSLEPVHIDNASRRAMQLLGQLRRVMWDYVGLVRTPNGLVTAMEAMADIRAEAKELHRACPTVDTSGALDAAYAGEAVAAAAFENKVSAGAHYIVPDSEYDDEDVVAVAAR